MKRVAIACDHKSDTARQNDQACADQQRCSDELEPPRGRHTFCPGVIDSTFPTDTSSALKPRRPKEQVGKEGETKESEGIGQGREMCLSDAQPEKNRHDGSHPRPTWPHPPQSRQTARSANPRNSMPRGTGVPSFSSSLPATAQNCGTCGCGQRRRHIERRLFARSA